MSKNLILIVSIFVFWLFIYLTNVKEEQKAENNLERTRREREERGLGNGLKHSYITSPVKAKGAS